MPFNLSDIGEGIKEVTVKVIKKVTKEVITKVTIEATIKMIKVVTNKEVKNGIYSNYQLLMYMNNGANKRTSHNMNNGANN